MAIASFETYVGRRSLLHQWTPRLKLVSLGGLMFAFAAVKQLPLILPMALITAIIYALSGLPLSFLLKRLRYPGLFILMVMLALPLTSGEIVLAQWGPVALRQEGLLTMALVVGRFLSILTLGFVLLGTTPFLTLLRALRSLRLPPLLADMTLLTYRYLLETAEMLSVMQQSMKLRGFGQRRSWLKLAQQDLKQLVGLMGTLLVRSYERSERIYRAMQLRGYGQLKHSPVRPPVDAMSLALTGLSAIIAVIFLLAELWMS